MGEEARQKSRKEDSGKKEESKRSHRDRNREDRDRDRDRHKDREHKKDRESRYSERERSNDEKRDRERQKDKLHKEKDREKEKHRSRDDERAKERGRDREDREVSKDKEERVSEKREREEEKEKEKMREKREREEEKEKEKIREKREREEEKEKEKIREKREREEEKEKERIREKREREEEKEREKVREKREREREREREMEKEREKVREKRERERDRDGDRRGREKEERERGRERIRDREKRRDADRDYSSDDNDVKESDRKRRKRDDDYRNKDRERSSKSNKHRDENEDSVPQIRPEEEDSSSTKEKSREEDLAEEQRKLDEEMEKRRRRVQEWQELRRKREETEREKLGVEATAEEPKSGKTWTLEGESDDEEAAPDGKLDTDMYVDGNGKSMDGNTDDMTVDSENGHGISASQDATDDGVADEEIDPLDAFMNSMVLPEVEKLKNALVPAPDDLNSLEEKNGELKGRPKKGGKSSMGRIISGEDSDSDYGDIGNEDDSMEDEDDEEFMKRVKKTKAEKLSIVDHSKIDYPPFRKNFYIEVKEIARMTAEEVSVYRKQLELKIHGKDVPKPVKTWHQTGLSNKILEMIKKLNYEKPMPIQAQALPVIMSGRDCIGVAKTGSGKTLAFVLPMLRHIKDQPPLMPGDGPIGLIMAPTRELVQQIHSDIRKFTKVLGVSCVPVYGGSGVAQQISELKRGAEIVVCTPGRMIDILCTSSGKITNLRRVTYFVMDEADRMFDMGFEPQITRIVQNTRPDRQTVLFSATFPRQVEILARKVLNKPIEIQVGGRSVVNKDISQQVEVRPETDRFLRLLELLGEWYEKGKILIFVHSQEKCDALFRDLIKHGYPCLSLHGAKDQTDRESTISDFKSNVCNLLIATSVAARGLDVKELELVINFDVPNHYEDYVHRVGRTGRAGRKGCAITFISEEDSRYAPDLVKALELSEQVVPDDLKALADGFMAKVNQGLEQAHGTGYGGSGFKFNEEEDEVRRAAKKAQAKEYGFEEDKSDSEDEDEGVRKAGGDLSQQAILAQAAAFAAATKASAAAGPTPAPAVPHLPNGGLPVSLPVITGMNISGAAAFIPGAGLTIGQGDAAARAAALAAAMNLQHNLAKIQADAMAEHYEAELEINDFPQNARWKVTHKETLGPISEWTGAAITTRGQYFPSGKAAGPGERKLYLFIEGPTEQSVKRAKAELKRVLEDITMQASSLPGSAQPGRYSVV